MLNIAPETLDEILMGDFDGDAVTDVFVARDGAWWYYAGGVGDPVLLNASGYAAGELAAGDFDGDGVSDIFRADGVEWKWSREGANLAMRDQSCSIDFKFGF